MKKIMTNKETSLTIESSLPNGIYFNKDSRQMLLYTDTGIFYFHSNEDKWSELSEFNYTSLKFFNNIIKLTGDNYFDMLNDKYEIREAQKQLNKERIIKGLKV